MYTHRGAYLNALGEMLHSGLTHDSVYLWTLPMFHCNGWCTAWAVVAVGGTQVCLRDGARRRDLAAIDTSGVTHLNGAPTVVATSSTPRGPTSWTTRRHHDRRGPAQPDGARACRADGLPDRARLRPHRDLRSVLGVPMAAPVGRARAGATGAAAGPAGRRDDPGRPDAGGRVELRDGQLVDVPADGRRWARSPCAATT